jgi:hypothetical protein
MPQLFWDDDGIIAERAAHGELAALGEIERRAAVWAFKGFIHGFH